MPLLFLRRLIVHLVSRLAQHFNQVAARRLLPFPGFGVMYKRDLDGSLLIRCGQR
jgi:hypothetical protein